MAGEYTLNLSNGQLYTTVYPLETVGPDNRSTPRKVLRALPSFEIVGLGAVDAVGSPGGTVLKFTGDVSGFFPVGFDFDLKQNIAGSPTPASYLTVTVANAVVPGSGSPGTLGAWYDSGQNETNVIINEILGSPVTPGSPAGAAVGDYAVLNVFTLGGDVVYRFETGFSFDVELSAFDNGTYTVSSFGSFTADPVTSGIETVIPVDEVIPSDALPYGQIVYTVLADLGSPLEQHPSISLPGRGTLLYGQKLLLNSLHMLENFAADTAPELNTNLGSNPAASPLVGQQWYDTTAGSEGMRIWDGIKWSSNVNIQDGVLVFTDPGNGNAKIYLTAAEGDLPGMGSPITEEPGLVLWPASPTLSPAGSIFTILSNGLATRFQVTDTGNITLGSALDLNMSAVGDVDIDALGNVEIDSVGGNITLSTTAGSPSGTITLGSAFDLNMSAVRDVNIDANGDVEINSINGDVILGTSSGSPQVGGNVVMQTPPQLPQVTVAQLIASPITYSPARPGQLVYVSDDGSPDVPIIAYSDGANWRRMTDASIIA